MYPLINDEHWESLINNICNEVSELTGNILTEKQRPMVESRIRRRMMDLKITSPKNYNIYWNENKDKENTYLTGLLTTHFTAFFREFTHFEWILKEIPNLVENAKNEGRNSLRFWSAACSKGQEVWSLCMWLEMHMSKIAPGFGWSILGTDIDGQSIKEAENAVYHRRELETAPRHLWEGAWIRGTQEISDWYKLKDSFRKRASFSTMNLLKLNVPVSEKFDVIFCRNVLIYFEKQKQEIVVKELLRHLTPQGALITGLSESLTGYGLPIKGVHPSVYKRENAVIHDFNRKKRSKAIPSEIEAKPVPMRILCVDDSPTVLMILKKILNTTEFEVVGTASNGEEALKKYEELRPDAITLDLHMPVMDGVTFLEKTQISKKIPVIVVSSVGRDYAPLVKPLFDMGVSDFVEKPSLATIDLIGEELCQKLKMGWSAKHQKLDIKKSVSQYVNRKRPNGHIIFAMAKGDEQNLYHVLTQQDWNMDEITVIYDGKYSDLIHLEKEIRVFTSRSSKLNIVTDVKEVKNSSLPTIWLSFKHYKLEKLTSSKRKNDFLVIEETGDHLKNKITHIDDESPVTSFSYLINKLLGGE